MHPSWIRKSRARKLMLWLIVPVLLGALFLLPPVMSYGTVGNALKIPHDGFAVVARSSLIVGVEGAGEFESADNEVIISQCEWTVPLLWKVEEGTAVKKGDVIARLDSYELEQRARAREVLLLQARTQLERAETDFQIQKLTNESRLSEAQMQAKMTKLELEGYQNAEFPQQRHALERDVALAEEAVVRGKKQLEFAERMVQRGYQDPQSREKERLNVHKLELQLQSKRNALKLLLKYDYPRQLASLESAAEQAERALKRIRSEAKASILNREIRVQAYRRVVSHHESYLERVNRSIAACTLRAAQDGEIIFARERSSSPETLETGDEVRFLQEVAQLPDREQVQVTLRLHESRIRKVGTGQPAAITADAVNGTTLTGHVASVSSVPLRGHFPRHDEREYEVTVSVDADSETLRRLAPGLSANVRVLTAQRRDVLNAPLRSVVNIAGRPVVFIRQGDELIPRDVETGIANDEQIELLNGVTVGDEIVANPRATCPRQVDALQAQAQSPRTLAALWTGSSDEQQ